MSLPSYMLQAEEEKETGVKSLEALWVDKILESLNMDTAFDIYHFADMMMCDRLKINIIKFFAMNVVCLFERVFKSQADQMPQYLWHDIENFIKSEAKDKYTWQNFDELDKLPIKIDCFSGYSELPSKDEWDEIYAGLLELYQSNEDVEENRALLQRAKEVKNWYRRLLKKIRNKKSTSISDNKKSFDLEAPEDSDNDSDDDIFISDEDIDQPSHDLITSDDEKDNQDELEYQNKFYQEFYQCILNFISEYIGDDIFKDFVEGRKKSSDSPFVFETFQANNTRKYQKHKANKKNKKVKKISNADRKRTESNASITEWLITSEKVVPEIDEKTAKQLKKEMKAKIKELMPLPAPKPTVSLDDLDYQIVEVNGEYKKVKSELVEKQSFKLQDMLDKKKQK